MKYSEFEKFRNRHKDFSKDNLIGSILFILCATIIILGGLLYEKNQLDRSYVELYDRLRVESIGHQHYKKIAKKYKAERSQIVDVSFYTRSKNETDSTPNQTAILTFARPGFTVAVSHDLKWMLGHYIYITGKGVFYVEDLMNERWKKKIDILVGTKKEARKLGLLRNVEVVVLGKELDLYYE